MANGCLLEIESLKSKLLVIASWKIMTSTYLVLGSVGLEVGLPSVRERFIFYFLFF